MLLVLSPKAFRKLGKKRISKLLRDGFILQVKR